MLLVVGVCFDFQSVGLLLFDRILGLPLYSVRKTSLMLTRLV